VAPASPLALGSGEAARRGDPTRRGDAPENVLNLTVLMVVTGGFALFGALIGAYAAVGHAASQWPPKGFTADRYVGTMLTITLVMSALTVEWACYAVKRDDPAQATWGLLLTAGFGLAFADLLWFLGRNVNFGPGSTQIGPFAVVFFALIVAAGFVALVGVVGVVLALSRTMGRQMTSTSHEMVRAVAWIAVFATIWLFT